MPSDRRDSISYICGDHRGLARLASTGLADGDSDAVTVEADGALQAVPMALSHCSHYGRATQFEREVSAAVFQYRCIAKE